MKRPARRLFAAAILGSLLIGVAPSPASAHECKAKRSDSFHSPGNHKAHCRAKK